eukprot:COSAG01_NODE_537_length_15764_cov_54.273795_20_plen_103_part_00
MVAASAPPARPQNAKERLATELERAAIASEREMQRAFDEQRQARLAEEAQEEATERAERETKAARAAEAEKVRAHEVGEKPAAAQPTPSRRSLWHDTTPWQL